MAKLTVDDIDRNNFSGEDFSVRIDEKEFENFINSTS